MRCPKCKQKVLQKSGDTTRLRTKGPITFGKDGTAQAKCYWCGEEVTIPIAIQEGTSVEEERFFIPK